MEDNQQIQVAQNQEKKWRNPPTGRLKCNIGFGWSKEACLGGGSWVLRDEFGSMLLQSRRAFSNINNLAEIKFQSLLWSMKGLKSHDIDKIYFAFTDPDLVNAVFGPKAWPSFNFKSSELLLILKGFQDWSLVLESTSANRGASLIALSVVQDFWCQSYVALGPPAWLSVLFEDERPCPLF